MNPREEALVRSDPSPRRPTDQSSVAQKKRPLVVGLTGGIGAGKSTVARLLERRGAVVLDADAMVHDLLAEDSETIQAISQTFGPTVLDERGHVDRRRLARHIFDSRTARKRLELIVHPRLQARAARRIAQARREGGSVVVFDAALLVETKAHRQIDLVVVVVAPAAERVDRLARRDRVSPSQTAARMGAQSGDEEKVAAADWVIENAAGFDDLERQVGELWEALVGALQSGDVTSVRTAHKRGTKNG